MDEKNEPVYQVASDNTLKFQEGVSVEPVKGAAVNPEIWGSKRGIELVGIIVVALAAFAGLDLIVMTAIYMNRGELPDIFGTLATIALSALAGVIGGAYASRSDA